MSAWSAGYRADIGYTYGYYTDLNPAKVKMAFLASGLVPPEVGVACELGFGQGVSINMHAAASATRWYGTDFSPAQAGFAQMLAHASGSGAVLLDDAFNEFCSRADLPDFDSIGLHGIWSWISDDNRKVIVDFIRRKLKVGGVVYVSYNTFPGWATFAPLRHLLTQHASVMGASGQSISARIDGAIEFAEKLLATDPCFLQANPGLAERLQRVKGQNRGYLAHEYFNLDWHPMHFADMAQWLAPAKLDFACSANYLDHVEVLNLTASQQALLGTLPDATFQQGARDFMVNQQFRKDYWVKGARKLSGIEQSEALRALRLVLVVSRADVPMKVTGTLGEGNLTEALYCPVLDLMADNKPRTILQIEHGVKDRGISFTQLLQVVMVLTGGGYLASAQEDAVTQGVKPSTDKLNSHLINKARSGADIAYLASPVTGGGLPVGRFEQLFLLAIQRGHKTTADWAKFVWNILDSKNQKLLKEGKTLETSEENIAELTVQANVFAGKHLPLFKALNII